METIKVARYRKSPYIFNHIANGSSKRYEWAGSKGDRYDIKPLPTEAVDWLMMNSQCFKNGELVIIEDTEEAKEIISNLGSELEEYAKNTHTREEIVKILNSTQKAMIAALEGITVDEEKRFIIEIAKELGQDLPGGKLKALAEWSNIPQDVLFD